MVDDRRERGQQAAVHDDDLVLGVVDDVHELVGGQPDVERVHDRAHAGDRVVGLEVFLVVPAERGHRIARRRRPAGSARWPAAARSARSRGSWCAGRRPPCHVTHSLRPNTRAPCCRIVVIVSGKSSCIVLVIRALGMPDLRGFDATLRKVTHRLSAFVPAVSRTGAFLTNPSISKVSANSLERNLTETEPGRPSSARWRGRPALCPIRARGRVFSPASWAFAVASADTRGGRWPNAKLVVGESNDYNPAALVRHGVIVVTINYRLGLFAAPNCPGSAAFCVTGSRSSTPTPPTRAAPTSSAAVTVCST